MLKILMIFAGFLTVFSSSPIAADKGSAVSKNFYDFSFKDINGEPLPLSSYKGKVVLVVNTASRCGFTPQYEGLQKLYDTYKDKGLIILGVPSNDFLWQEPGSNAEIKKFCQTKFGVTFPMTEKVHVKGPEADPFYAWAAAQEKGETPGWNFHKFLIGRNGALLHSFGSRIAPDDRDLTAAVQKALSEK